MKLSGELGRLHFCEGHQTCSLRRKPSPGQIWGFDFVATVPEKQNGENNTVLITDRDLNEALSPNEPFFFLLGLVSMSAVKNH